MLCGNFTLFTFIEAINSMQVLDPIDGTRGFLKGSEALYVVGLSN
jgi:3'(2'), 5'-bisphosphate nucleotidase